MAKLEIERVKYWTSQKCAHVDLVGIQSVQTAGMVHKAK